MRALLQVRDFLEMGGWALMLIAGATLLMWTLILERAIYFRSGHRRLIADIVDIWRNRDERHSWQASRIRRLMISKVQLSANRFVTVVRAIIAVCPLLGLLGTVTGMIEVYDVMAIAGSGNARAMASGVSKAMITTIAGLVAALSGLVTMPFIDRYIQAAQIDLVAALRLDDAQLEEEPLERGLDSHQYAGVGP